MNGGTAQRARLLQASVRDIQSHAWQQPPSRFATLPAVAGSAATKNGNRFQVLDGVQP